jgi:hypothetical protein
VNASQRFAANKAFERFYAQREFAERERALRRQTKPIAL